MTLSAFRARLGLAFTALVTSALVACGSPDEPAPTTSAEIPVRLEQPEMRDGGRVIRASGTVGAGARATLAFHVSGYVSEVSVVPGDRVAAGTVLARLAGDEADARVAAARADADLAELQLGRMERLFADSAVARASLDEVRAARDAAAAALSAAEFARSNSVVRAPAAGRVLSVEVEETEWVGAGAPVVGFAATADAAGRGWVVRARLPESDVVRVETGDSVAVRLASLGDAPLVGVVSEIGDAVASRTFPVEVRILSAPARIRSGMIAELEIRTVSDRRVAALPLRSVVRSGEGWATVFTVDDDGRAREVRVPVAGFEDGRVLTPVDALDAQPVVTDGAAWISDGSAVRIEAAPVGGDR